MLIANVFSVMQMKPRYGAVSYKGHVVNLAHNLPKIVDDCQTLQQIFQYFLKADIGSANFRLSGKEEVAVE